MAVYERAGATFSEVRDWISSVGFGAGLGVILGAAFWHVVAIAASLRSLLSDT